MSLTIPDLLKLFAQRTPEVSRLLFDYLCEAPEVDKITSLITIELSRYRLSEFDFMLATAASWPLSDWKTLSVVYAIKEALCYALEDRFGELVSVSNTFDVALLRYSAFSGTTLPGDNLLYSQPTRFSTRLLSEVLEEASDRQIILLPEGRTVTEEVAFLENWISEVADNGPGDLPEG